MLENAGYIKYSKANAVEVICMEEIAREVQERFGFVDPVAPLLSAADVFISASHSEGLSLVLVEAMLAGVPIAL